MSLPLVSILIITWNRKADTLETVKCLYQQAYENFEIIVVDNGSTDVSADVLAQIPGITLIRLLSNAGPARARNVGANAASGPYLFFLDNDASPGRNAIRRLVQYMEDHDDVGILGCRIMNSVSRRIDQWIYAQPYDTHGRQSFDTYSFSAAGALIRADLFLSIGGFWEDLFIYNEEVDLALRVIRAGYRVEYAPAATILHRAAPTGRVAPGAYFYYQIRNWIWIFRRHYPALARQRKIALYCLLYIIKGLLAFRLGNVIRGIWDGLFRRRIVAAFPDKMTGAELVRYEQLNQRTSLRPGR